MAHVWRRGGGERWRGDERGGRATCASSGSTASGELAPRRIAASTSSWDRRAEAVRRRCGGGAGGGAVGAVAARSRRDRDEIATCGRLDAEAAKPRSTMRTVSCAAAVWSGVETSSDDGPSERCTTPLPCSHASTCAARGHSWCWRWWGRRWWEPRWKQGAAPSPVQGDGPRACRQRPVMTFRYCARASRVCRPPRSNQGLGCGTRGKLPTVLSPSHRKHSQRLPEVGGGVFGMARAQLSRKAAESKEASLCMWPSSVPSWIGVLLPPSHSSEYIASSFSPMPRALGRYSFNRHRSPPNSSAWKSRTEMPEASTVRAGWFGSSGFLFFFSPSS